jgi:hypothetical protein
MSVTDFLSRADKRVAKKAEIDEKKDIENPFVKYAKNRKCKALKLIFLSKKGFPDRTILCPNARIFFIEFKRKGKPPTPPQVACRKLLESFGFEYYICDEVGQAETILDEFLSRAS